MSVLHLVANVLHATGGLVEVSDRTLIVACTADGDSVQFEIEEPVEAIRVRSCLLTGIAPAYLSEESELALLVNGHLGRDYYRVDAETASLIFEDIRPYDPTHPACFLDTLRAAMDTSPNVRLSLPTFRAVAKGMNARAAFQELLRREERVKQEDKRRRAEWDGYLAEIDARIHAEKYPV